MTSTPAEIEALIALLTSSARASPIVANRVAAALRALLAENARLREALKRCMVGGNHLATHIDLNGPGWRGSPTDALQYYGAGLPYDAWCCWHAIMQAREAFRDD
jgi:hypothetical protein